MNKVLDRVVITRAFVGICHMQVCAVKDATDEEILAVCNQQNPSGTSNGWSQVIREVTGEEDKLFQSKKLLPVQCEDDPERLHFLVAC